MLVFWLRRQMMRVYALITHAHTTKGPLGSSYPILRSVWARASGSRSEASRRRCRGPRAWHQGVPRRSHYRFTGLDGSTGNDSLRYGHCFLIKSLSLSLSLSLHYTCRQARPSLGVGGLVMRCIVSCIAWGIASHWATFVVPPGLRQARYKRVDH